MPLCFLQEQKPPHTNCDDRNRPERTRTACDWLDNIEKRLVFKDKDKLKGPPSEVAYTRLCQFWRELFTLENLAHSSSGYAKQKPYLPPYLWSTPTALWYHRESWVMCAGTISAEIRADFFAGVRPGALLTATGPALVSSWLAKLSSSILGTWG